MTSVHELAIDCLIEENPDLKTKGFSRNLRRIMTEEGICDRMWWEEMEPSFRPDAYYFDRERREIHLYEVEDSRPIPKAKMQKLAQYWFDLDGDGWTLRLFVTDRYGHSVRELSLMDIWYAIIHRIARREIAAASA